MMTPRDLDFCTRLISVPFNNRASEISNCFIRRGCSIVMYSVLAGLGFNLFILIHSERLTSFYCVSSTSFFISFDAIVICVSSA